MKYDLSEMLDAVKAQTRMNKLIEDKKPIELIEIRPKRSIKANSYLHVCISLFAIEYGYTLNEAKTLLKREGGLIYEKEGQKFLKQTSKMDSKELSEFTEWIRNYASNQGLYIPSSEEYLANQINIDKTISQHKQYL